MGRLGEKKLKLKDRNSKPNLFASNFNAAKDGESSSQSLEEAEVVKPPKKARRNLFGRDPKH